MLTPQKRMAGAIHCPPAKDELGSGRVRRVRHRGAGDEDTCVRKMHNCLRSLQHTLHSCPVKLGETRKQF